MEQVVFKIDRHQLTENENVYLDLVRSGDIHNIERFINENFVEEGWTPVQHGRVIVLRHTDRNRKSSAFSSALYMGKYSDMGNTQRFLNGMVKAGHSYEPIRGESVSFLFIGVSKPVYDHLTTYTIRQRRVAGGLRANEPWGFVVPYEARDREAYVEVYREQLDRCQRLIRRAETEKDEGKRNEQLQAVRSLYPTGVILPPFQLDFSEEALVKNIFRQRVWERGAQGETVHVVHDMYEAVKRLDPEKWAFLEEYHGAHIAGHNRAMRQLRDKRPTLGDLLDRYGFDTAADIRKLDVYDFLMSTVGRMSRSMWDKE